MEKINIYIDDELIKWIDEKSKDVHLNFSATLRKILWDKHDEEKNQK